MYSLMKGILWLILVIGPLSCTPSSDTIKIAVVGPMTGDQSKQGNDLKNGVDLAVLEWNEKGGVL